MRYLIQLSKTNLDAITGGLRSVGVNFEVLRDFQIVSLIELSLGYVDFTDCEIVEAMIKNKAEFIEGEYKVNFAKYNYHSLISGLSDMGINIDDFSDEEIGSMLSFSLGYVDFSNEYILSAICGEIGIGDEG